MLFIDSFAFPAFSQHYYRTSKSRSKCAVKRHAKMDSGIRLQSSDTPSNTVAGKVQSSCSKQCRRVFHDFEEDQCFLSEQSF